MVPMMDCRVWRFLSVRVQSSFAHTDTCSFSKFNRGVQTSVAQRARDGHRPCFFSLVPTSGCSRTVTHWPAASATKVCRISF